MSWSGMVTSQLEVYLGCWYSLYGISGSSSLEFTVTQSFDLPWCHGAVPSSSPWFRPCDPLVVDAVTSRLLSGTEGHCISNSSRSRVGIWKAPWQNDPRCAEWGSRLLQVDCGDLPSWWRLHYKVEECRWVDLGKQSWDSKQWGQADGLWEVQEQNYGVGLRKRRRLCQVGH